MKELATFGAGCFWGVQHIFRSINGVISAKAGYLGGVTDNPTYEDICTGETGHAEVVQLEFDPQIVTYTELLDIFWKLHNPTTLNRQGADKGTQYRSAIFYHNDGQRDLAVDSKSRFDKANCFGKPSVTEITKATKFYQAEEYHQDYYLKRYQGEEGPICHTLRESY